MKESIRKFLARLLMVMMMVNLMPAQAFARTIVSDVYSSPNTTVPIVSEEETRDWMEISVTGSSTNGHFVIERGWVDEHGYVYLEFHVAKGGDGKDIKYFKIGGVDLGTIDASDLTNGSKLIICTNMKLIDFVGNSISVEPSEGGWQMVGEGHGIELQDRVITIYYYDDATKEEIRDSQVIPLKDGSEYDVWGYIPAEIADQNGGTYEWKYNIGNPIGRIDGADVRIDAYYAEKDAHAHYRVEHYKQGMDGSYPETPEEMASGQGEIGTAAQYDAKNYEGFSLVATEFVSRKDGAETPRETAAILADGSLVIKLYYGHEANAYGIQKHWNDDNNRDGKRPASVTLRLYKNGAATDTEKTLSGSPTADTWNDAFGSLITHDQDGNAISYTACELDSDGNAVSENGGRYNDDYTASAVTWNGAGAFEVTNTHAPERAAFSAVKVWDDEDNQDGLRPASISLGLFAGDTLVEEKTVTDANPVTFDAVDLYAGGGEIAYTIREKNAAGSWIASGEAYNAFYTMTGDLNGTAFTVTNAYQANPHTVTYKYEGMVPQAAPDCPKPEFHNEGTTVTVEPDPSLTGYTFVGWHTMPGQPVTVTDGQPTFVMPDGDVTLVGEWKQVPEVDNGRLRISKTLDTKDVDGAFGAPPGSFTFTVTNVADGTSRQVILNRNGSKTYEYQDLDGLTLGATYTVEEHTEHAGVWMAASIDTTAPETDAKVTIAPQPDGETTPVNSVTFQNTRSLYRDGKITATKTWNVPAYVKDTLTASFTLEYKAGEEGTWTPCGEAQEIVFAGGGADALGVGWSNLPEAMTDGTPIAYRVVETMNPTGVTAGDETAAVENGEAAFTNTFMETEANLIVTKIVVDASGQSLSSEVEFTMQLTRGGEPVGNVPYTVGKARRATDRYGQFTLRAGQSAVFGKLAYGSYKVVEMGYTADVWTPEYQNNIAVIDENWAGQTVTVTNTLATAKAMRVQKAWKGDTDYAFARPDVTFSLYATIGEGSKTRYVTSGFATVTEKTPFKIETVAGEEKRQPESGVKTFDGLPAYLIVKGAGGAYRYEPVSYSVEETMAANGYAYESAESETDGVAVYTNTLQTMDITGEKVWTLNGAVLEAYPAVTVRLMQGDQVIGATTIPADADSGGRYPYTFTGVPYREDGYTVRETGIEGGAIRVQGQEDAIPAAEYFTADRTAGVSKPVGDAWTGYSATAEALENELTIPETETRARAITVTKTLDLNGIPWAASGYPTFDFTVEWRDAGGTQRVALGITPGERGGVISGTSDQVIVPRDAKITVTETPKDGWTVQGGSVRTIEADAHGAIFTNRRDMIHSDGNVIITKRWNDEGAPEGTRPAASAFAGWVELQSRTSTDGAYTPVDGATPAVTANDDGRTYTVTYSGLPAYTEAGEAISYRVRESLPADTRYEAAQDTAAHGETITNRMKNEEPHPPTKTPSMSADDVYVEGTTQFVRVGGEIKYTIRYHNDLNTVATVTIRDTVPAGTELVEAPGAEVNGDSIVWMIPDVPPFSHGEVTVTVRVSEDALAEAMVNNTATISMGDSEQSVTAPGVPVAAPHLTVTKTVAGEPANGEFYTRGETVRYVIAVTNDGNLTVTDIGVTDSLSAGRVIANIPRLAPGESRAIPFEHVVTEADAAAGNIHNVASAVAPNPDDPGNTPTTPGEVDVPVRQLRLTVNYWYEQVGGMAAASSYMNLYSYGQPYSVASPRIAGYSASLMSVSGAITADTVVDVVYTSGSYTLTVQYRYMNGTVAAEDAVVRNMRYGDVYTIASPAIIGYVANQTSVSGVMPEGNVVLTVYYTAVPAAINEPNEPARTFVLIDEYGAPLGIGNVVMNVGDCFE